MIGALTKKWADESNILVDHTQEIESTNDFAKTDPFKNPRVVVTEFQSKGRGRGSHTWTSPKPGTSLLSTWILPIKHSLQPIASPLIGLALYKAVHQSWPNVGWGLKAPNDLYIKNKKVAGILLESISQGEKSAALVGLGMNFLAQPEIEIATHLAQHISEEEVRSGFKSFLDHWLVELSHALELGQHDQLQQIHADEILEALNKNPFYSQKFDAVLADGGLKNSSGTISWNEI